MKKGLTILYILMMLLPAAAAGKQDTGTETGSVRIGIMPDAGALPLLLMDGVETVPFMSAKERDTAMQLGELDGIMTDMVSVIAHSQKGIPRKVLTITESRFLIVGIPGFNEEDTWQVGLSENTVIEFMVDQLAGNKAVEKVGIPQVPVRMEMLRNGKIPLACLTDAMAWSLLSQDFPILRDQAGSGLEPAVLAFDAEYSESHPDVIADFQEGWNRAVAEINNQPEAFRSLLLEQIRLPDDPDAPYPVPEFRPVTLPSEESVQIVAEWYEKKYGLEKPVRYDELVIP